MQNIRHDWTLDNPVPQSTDKSNIKTVNLLNSVINDSTTNCKVTPHTVTSNHNTFKFYITEQRHTTKYCTCKNKNLCL